MGKPIPDSNYMILVDLKENTMSSNQTIALLKSKQCH